MNAVWLVARWEYVTRLRSKLFIVSTILFPLLIVGMSLGSVFLLGEQGAREIRLAVVSPDEAWRLRLAVELRQQTGENQGSPYSVINLPDADVPSQRLQAAALLEAGEIDAYLVIASDIIESATVEWVDAGKVPRGVYIDIRKVVQTLWTQAALERRQVDPAVLAVLERKLEWKSTQSQGSELSSINEIQAIFGPIMAVMILFFAIFLSSQVLMRGIISERSNRLAELLLSSVSAEDLMTGKILGLGALSLTQIGLYMAIATVAGARSGLDLFPAHTLLPFLLFALLGYFFYAAIFAAVGSLFESEQDAQQMVSVLSILPIIPLVTATVILTNPDNTIVRLASFFPPLTPFIMIIRVNVMALPLWELLGTALVLAISTWYLMRWSGIVFRTSLLLYGQRATLPEIVRWIRAG